VPAALPATDTRMLLQTNSYVVPKDRRAEHARLLRRFRQTLMRLGCEHFEVYEQVGSNWSSAEPTGRYVQLMRFRDRRHQLAVQAAERNDPAAQALIAEFCELINFPYQQQQGLFAVGFYASVLPVGPSRVEEEHEPQAAPQEYHEPQAAAPQGEPPQAATYQPVPLEPEPAEAESASADNRVLDTPEPTEDEHLQPQMQPLEPEQAAEEPQAVSHDRGSNGEFHDDQRAAPMADEPESSTVEDEPEPAIASAAPPRELDDVLAEHFAPQEEPAVPARSSGSGIGEVLDAGLTGDEDDLDIPLPAELIDESADLTPHPADAHEPDRRGEHRH